MSVLFIGISVFAHAPIVPQNPMSGNAAELLNLRLRHCRKAPCAPFRLWLGWGLGGAWVGFWCGLGGALVEPWCGFGGALVEPWGGFVVALYSGVYA